MVGNAREPAAEVAAKTSGRGQMYSVRRAAGEQCLWVVGSEGGIKREGYPRPSSVLHDMPREASGTTGSVLQENRAMTHDPLFCDWCKAILELARLRELGARPQTGMWLCRECEQTMVKAFVKGKVLG